MVAQVLWKFPEKWAGDHFHNLFDKDLRMNPYIYQKNLRKQGTGFIRKFPELTK